MARTAESVIASFTQRVARQEAIPPTQWLEAAMYINVLISEESNKLFTLEQAYNAEIIKYIDLGKSNAESEKRAKSTEEYVAYRKQQSFIKQIEQFILLAKKQATIDFKQGA